VLVGGGVTGWLALRAAFDPNREADQRPRAAMLWKQRPTIDEKPINSWASEGMVVAMHEDSLDAFRADTGDKAWDLVPPLRPGDRAKLSRYCGMSQEVKDGLGVIAFGPYIKDTYRGTGCSTIAAVDIKSGALKWQLDLPVVEERLTTNFTDPEIVGDLVVFVLHNVVHAVRLSDHSEVWRYDLEPGDRSCIPQAPEYSERTVAIPLDCTTDGLQEELVLLDTASGVEKGRAVFDSDGPANLLSANPPVVQISQSADVTAPGSLLVFNETAQQVLTIPETQPAGRLYIDPVNSNWDYKVRTRKRIIVTNGLLIAPTMSVPVSQYRETNRIIAVDLKTGRQRWDVELGEKIVGMPFAKTENGVLAINTGTYENPPRVFEIPLSGGSAEPVSGLFPSELAGIGEYNLHRSDGVVYGMYAGPGKATGPPIFAVK
jgi:outer membrane protein assembly factor BamB